ncbi:F0F1 ATP synthase subunit delta, partial [Clostridioides difficile]
MERKREKYNISSVKVLVDKDRISYLEDIELAYKELLNKKNNVIDGVAISAIPMS